MLRYILTRLLNTKAQLDRDDRAWNLDECNEDLVHCARNMQECEASLVSCQAYIDDALKSAVCVVCFTHPRMFAYIPCHHFSVCEECVKILSQCPLCRKKSTSTIRLFT